MNGWKERKFVKWINVWLDGWKNGKIERWINR